MLLPACKRHQQSSFIVKIDQHLVDPAPLDIPTPVSVQLYEYDSLRENTKIYGFERARSEPAYHKDFYATAMAEAGWHQESCVQGATETVFIFKKPRAWCTLVLGAQRVRFYVSSRNKKV